MIFQEAIYTYLTNYAALKPMIRNRVYYGQLPQRPTIPAISCFKVNGASVENQEGQSGLYAGLWQFDCWSDSITQAAVLADELRKALDLVGQNLSGLQVTCSHVRDQDDFDEDSVLYRVISEFRIFNSQEVKS